MALKPSGRGKDIRIQSNRGAAADTAEMDEEGGADAAATAARRRVVAQVAKKSLIQNAIPIFIELKRLLESKNSPLTGCLMECLRVLLKDNKSEIDDILIADKQLQKELLYDIQKYEAVKTKSKVTEAISTMQKSNVYCSPPGRAGPSMSKFANEPDVQSKLAEKLGSVVKVASVMADVAAEETVKSVLREVNRGTSTPLNSISMPKLKSSMGGAAVSGRDRPRHILESLRRRQSFDLGEEN